MPGPMPRESTRRPTVPSDAAADAAGDVLAPPLLQAATKMDSPANRASPVLRMRMCPPPGPGPNVRGGQLTRDRVGRIRSRSGSTAGGHLSDRGRKAASGERCSGSAASWNACATLRQVATIPIILDCDPGHDDALAIVLALARPELRLLAITTVAGNAPLDRTTRNALRVLTLLGRTDVPVAAGADRPLVREPWVPVDVPRRFGSRRRGPARAGGRRRLDVCGGRADGGHSCARPTSR